MLKPFLAALAALVFVPWILWGFAGELVLLAVIPAFILGATAAHWRGPSESDPQGKHQVRPAVVTLGVLFGLASSVFIVLLMQARTSPETVTWEVTATIDAPPRLVWPEIADPLKRPTWHSWMKDVDMGPGTGGAPAVGKPYTSQLLIERGQAMYADHVVTHFEPERLFAWTLEPKADAAWEMRDIREAIALEPQGEGTLVRYTITYRVPSTFGRLLERMVIRRSLEKVAEHSLAQLADNVLQ